MKIKHFIFTLLTLIVSQTYSFANSGSWTDSNGTTWGFDYTSGSGTARLINYWNSGQACISGTIPESLTIPSKVYSVGEWLTVKSIGSYACYNCTNITSVTIPEGIETIESYAFYNCTNLTSFNIPESIKNLSGNAFVGTAWYQNQSDGVVYIGNSVLCYKGVIPDNSNITITEGTKTICTSAFSGRTKITSITLPSSLTRIEESAFYKCTGLTSINIPEGVTSIGYSAFGFHGMIVSFSSTTPCTNDGIGTGVRLLVPSESVTAYKEAWPSCASVIVDAAYGNSTVNVTAKESSSAVLDEIGEAHTSDVVSLKVKGTFNSYDLMVFRNKMNNLLELDLSEANVVSSSYKYYSTYKSKDNIVTSYFAPPQVVTLKLPKDITALEDRAFYQCNKLREMILPEGISSIPSSAFYSCEELSSLSIPESVTSIGNYAFHCCYKLLNLHLPKSLKGIGTYAFEYCKFTELHLPPYMESIGNYAFSNCSNLRTIYAYMPDIITIGTNTFNDYTNQVLYVPEFLYYNYYYDTNWSQFSNVIRTTLSVDDYTKMPTNSDITMGENDQRIPDMSNGEHVDGEINTQGSFTVEGDEPQAFNEVEQILDGEGQGGSLIGEDDGETEGNLRVNNLRVKINVKAGRWYFFCFPFDVTIANCEYPGQYAWRYYDGTWRAENGNGGWKPVTGETLTALEGYAFQTSHTGNLIISFNHPTFGGNRPKPLNSYTSGNAANASWNLVGNPYSSFYDFLDDTFLSPITVYNSSTGSYQAYRPGDDECHLQPYEAFFVQKPVGVDLINFTPGNRESYNKGQEKKNTRAARRRARGIDPDRCLINLQILSGEQETDRTRVVLNEQKSRDYELDCDASKFLSADAQAQLYTVENGIQMAINERPLAGDIRLGYTAKKAGTLSISAPRMDLPMMLVDTKLGITFDLSVGTYDFETQAGTFNDRFMLCLSGEATAIKTMKEKTGVCFGTQDGGIAIGGAEGKTVSIYTTGGAMAAQHSGNGFIALKSGVYVVNVDGVTAKVSVK